MSDVINFNSKYADLLNLANDPKTSMPLCISEFIDNSIASWLEQKEKGINEKLIVNIDIYTNSHKQLSENTIYVISDNAAGIKHEDLQFAMRKYDGYGIKSNKGIHQYGVGMKKGIFWLGVDGVIYTKQKNETDISIGKYNSSLERISEDVGLTVEKVSISEFANLEIVKNKTTLKNYFYSNKSGTIVVIKDVYSTNDFKKPSIQNIVDLCFFLGFRFSNYLNEDDFEINIRHYRKDELNKKYIEETTGSTELIRYAKWNREKIKGLGRPIDVKILKNNMENIGIFQLSTFVSDNSTKSIIIDKLITALNLIETEPDKSVISLKSLFVENFSEDKAVIKFSNWDLIKKIIKKIVSDEKLIFDIDVPLLINNTNNVAEYIDSNGAIKKIIMPLKLYILSKSSKHNSGLIVTHNNRYILQPTKKQQMNSGKEDENFGGPLEITSFGNTETHLWVSLKMDLEKVPGNESCKYWKPEENKSTIVWNVDGNGDNPYSKENLKYSLRMFMNSITPILNCLPVMKKIKGGSSELQQLNKDLKSVNDSIVKQYAKNIDLENESISMNVDMSNYLTNYGLEGLEFTEKNIKIYITNDRNEHYVLEKVLLDNQNDGNIVYKFNKSNKLISIDESKSTFLIGMNFALLLAIIDQILTDPTKKMEYQSVSEILNDLADVEYKRLYK